jgi:hypothetical protein
MYLPLPSAGRCAAGHHFDGYQMERPFVRWGL